MTGDAAANSVDLADYIALLKRRWKLIAVSTVVLCGLAVGYTAQKPTVYSSHAEVALPDPASSETPKQLTEDVPTEVGEMKSVLVADAAAKLLHNGKTATQLRNHLSVSAGANLSRILDISFVADSPRAAQAGAQAFADAYIATKQAEQRQGNAPQIAQYNASIKSYDTQISAAQATLNDTPAKSPQATTLQANIQTLKTQLNATTNQLDNLQAQPVDGGQVINPAILPQAPKPSGLARNAVVGLMGGLAVGIGGAFVLDRLDEQVRESADLEQVIGVTALGTIPLLPEAMRKAPYSLVAIQAPDSPSTDAFRRLRTSVTLAAQQADITVIGITSAIGGEGKSTVAANLATVLSQVGERTLLISGDLRQPTLEDLFEIGHSPGLVDVLLGEIALADAIVMAGALAVLPDGKTHRNPTDLLQSPAMRRLLAEAKAAYDLVIIDTPPVLAVADVIGMGHLLDSVILVVSVTDTTEAQLTEAENQLSHAGSKIMGAIVNRGTQSNIHYERYRRVPDKG